MPELPEVENAAVLIRSVALGKTISQVQTNEDTIVYTGTSHEEFANEITGRVVKNAGRYGKIFYIELEGAGKFPVLHFGMTGALRVKGRKAMTYQSSRRNDSDAWPPRFMKFVLHLHAPGAPGPDLELAFVDARRLGRIRLCASPLTEPPISELGFDPILSMPSLEAFTPLVLKRSCPVKALLLDQSFSAGIGNWIADEVLYHAHIHPEQRCNTLTEDQLIALHHRIEWVCQTAVDVNADHSKFPQNWLFRYRWGKGKKEKSQSMKLLDGKPATIKWLTVGGRTSAFVTELQKLPSKEQDDVAGSSSRLATIAPDSPRSSTSEAAETLPVSRKRKGKAPTTAVVRRTRRKSGKDQEDR